ncbi:MAG: hypothetical protein ACI9WU_005460, partial [Myxococcota bacterium]
PISGRTAWSDSDQRSSPGATSKSRPMNITHFNDSAIDSCSGYGKPLTPENECLAVTLALVRLGWIVAHGFDNILELHSIVVVDGGQGLVRSQHTGARGAD